MKGRQATCFVFRYRGDISAVSTVRGKGTGAVRVVMTELSAVDVVYFYFLSKVL